MGKKDWSLKEFKKVGDLSMYEKTSDKATFSGLVMLVFVLHTRKQLEARKKHGQDNIVLRAGSVKRTIELADELAKELGVKIKVSKRTKQRTIMEMVDNKKGLLNEEREYGNVKVGMFEKVFEKLVQELQIVKTLN